MTSMASMTSMTTARVRAVFVETWGCQMNELDGRRLVGLLLHEGYREALSAEEADLVLLNTCSVRDKAEQKVYDRLGRLALMKRERPGMVIGVCGCVAQQEGEHLLKRAPYVDFVLGTGRIEALPTVLRRVDEEGDRPVEIGFDLDEVAYSPGSIAHALPYRAAITVIEGCNKSCTFCVVPLTRGRERSRRLSDVVAEAKHLVEDGVVEVELLGQTVNAYRDPDSGKGLSDLLVEIGRLPGLRRLRFVTSHPRNFDDRLIQAMAETRTACRTLHLPVQSGSDRVLGRMKRQYTREDYVGLVNRLRRAMPELALSTDVIVGFPGEGENEFAETLSLLQEIQFSNVFSFTYSPRPHTAAARWERDVPPRLASERLARLMDLQQDIQRTINNGLVGSQLEVLVEGLDRKGGRLSGRSACNRVVNFDGTGPRVADFVDVLVEKGLPNSLSGRLLGTPLDKSAAESLDCQRGDGCREV
jgi:tRNA-2-methylthio-N6-dimethylallyladenosine synthase